MGFLSFHIFLMIWHTEQSLVLRKTNRHILGFSRETEPGYRCTVIPWCLQGIGSRTPVDSQVPYIKWRNIYIQPRHILLYTLSHLYISYNTVQCKFYINSCLSVANSSFVFWNSLEFFFQSIVILQLAESAYVEHMNMKGQLYMRRFIIGIGSSSYGGWEGLQSTLFKLANQKSQSEAEGLGTGKLLV